MSKKYDIVAIVGEYQNAQGETKKKYQNVGAVMANDKGHYMLLSKTFNPAGLADPERESIILSLFEPKPRDGQQAPQPQQQGAPSYDDAVPF